MADFKLEPLHRLHSYSARFPSEIAEAAIREFTSCGDNVCDPFCGSGTTLVAGLAAARNVVGVDIDVLAGILSELKCEPYSVERYAKWKERFIPRLDRQLSQVSASWTEKVRLMPGRNLQIGKLNLSVPDFSNLTYWFPPQVSAALAAISDLAHRCHDSHYEKLILISLSASILAKWPHTLSYAMDVDHTRPHRRIQKISLQRVRGTFVARLERCIKCLGGLRTAYDDVFRLGNASSRVIYPQDARTAASIVGNESQSLVVTSPPYFNAVDYPRAHRLSVCWMNGHAPEQLVSRRNYIGLRYGQKLDEYEWLRKHPTIRRRIPLPIRDDHSLAQRVCAFFSDLDDVLKETWKMLQPGGHGVYVIANNIIKSERLASHLILADLAMARGFVVKSSDRRQIAQLRRRFPVGPFGFDGPMTHEYVIVLQKPKTKFRSRT
jgi:hypothetical protein